MHSSPVATDDVHGGGADQVVTSRPAQAGTEYVAPSTARSSAAHGRHGRARVEGLADGAQLEHARRQSARRWSRPSRASLRHPRVQLREQRSIDSRQRLRPTESAPGAASGCLCRAPRRRPYRGLRRTAEARLDEIVRASAAKRSDSSRSAPTSTRHGRAEIIVRQPLRHARNAQTPVRARRGSSLDPAARRSRRSPGPSASAA